MKMLSILLVALLSGCALFPSDPDRPGYQEGRTAAFAYVLTEPVQPPEVNKVIMAGYAVLKGIFDEFGETDPIDALVMMEIYNLYPDTTPEFRDFVFNFYKMARQRLDTEIDLNPDIPTPALLKNFLQGVEDSLHDWKGE